MKQIGNITLLVIILSIPFALSQTRKAIPAGRYEALSGIKGSHGQKSVDSTSSKETINLFLNEVARHIPQTMGEKTFLTSGAFDSTFLNFLTAKGLRESKEASNKLDMLLSDNIIRDSARLKTLTKRGSLILLKESRTLKDVISLFPQSEVVLYQAEVDTNYYLLKHK